MCDSAAIQINVDTLSDGVGHFVRTEIEARLVTVHGPFSDPQTAQEFKAGQLSRRSKVSEAIKQNLREVASGMPDASVTQMQT